MEIDAEVKSISKLQDYFFIVPDYQREYVWKPDDQVEQFLIDIDNEYDQNAEEQNSYFIGSIIIVGNNDKYEVIDGQQRLTTIIIMLCAIRDLLKDEKLTDKEERYLERVKQLLADFDLDTDENKIRLELQYEESLGFLEALINQSEFSEEKSPSIIKMEKAYARIKSHLETYLDSGVSSLTNFVRYFLTKIELVAIKSKSLSGALKIFETINQRGVGLNAMDLVKNLLFREARETEFNQIKEIWKSIIKNLQDCGEDGAPLRFLRYFLMARYYKGVIREDGIYKWFLTEEGKDKTNYQAQPLAFAKELKVNSKRYSKLVKATELLEEGGDFPNVSKIGFINKYKSRQHLILLLALDNAVSTEVIEYLAEQIESFFFFTVSLGIQAKDNERNFAAWAKALRGKQSIQEVEEVVEGKIVPYIKKRQGAFMSSFQSMRHNHYRPQYRERYVYGCIENTIRKKMNMPIMTQNSFKKLQIEHILPQKPKDGVLPPEFEDQEEYEKFVYQIGNVTMIESSINQALNNCNDMEGNWFKEKQEEYRNSNVITTKLLDNQYKVGSNTAINRFKVDYEYEFEEWGKIAIEKRQEILLRLIFETWKFNGKSLKNYDQ